MCHDAPGSTPRDNRPAIVRRYNKISTSYLSKRSIKWKFYSATLNTRISQPFNKAFNWERIFKYIYFFFIFKSKKNQGVIGIWQKVFPNDTSTVESRFKKFHFSFLKSGVVWFQKDLCSESKNWSSEINALCRWICNLRSFLNQEFTVVTTLTNAIIKNMYLN